jgi:hypothetical protein
VLDEQPGVFAQPLDVQFLQFPLLTRDQHPHVLGCVNKRHIREADKAERGWKIGQPFVVRH